MKRIQTRQQCLNELDPPAWGEPPYPSNLVKTCHRLRTKPIGEFTSGDLRIMLGQNIGSEFLLPIALEILSHHPLEEGDFYPGDLLVSVLRLDARVWEKNPSWAEEVGLILAKVDELPREVIDASRVFQAARTRLGKGI